MHFNTHVLIFPALFLLSGVLAQLSGMATSYTPNITYPADDAFVFCSTQNCTGTCEVIDSVGLDAKAGHDTPNGMGYLSMYWYDPDGYTWDVYTCISYECATAVNIGPNTCYNLYDNGVATDFYTYYFLGY